MNRCFYALIVLIAQTLSIDLSAQKTKQLIQTPASDTRIEYTGRTFVNDDDVSYDWSGVYLRVKFEGTYLAMKCSDTKNTWFNLWVDKEMSPVADKKFLVGAKDTIIVLAEGLKRGTHEIILQKRTEADEGLFTVSSFISEGEILQAAGRKNRHIEFVAASYACGYGVESSSKNDPFLAETENCNLTYAAIAARYFDADFSLVCHSGQGIARNFNSKTPGYYMPDRYKQTFDNNKEVEWKASAASYTPDVVVINLGGNDFSCGLQPSENSFRKNYIRLLKDIKAYYGEKIPILCMVPANPNIYDYISNAVAFSQLKNVAYMVLSKYAYDSVDETGAHNHPNYKGQLKVASCMIPYVSTLTGWEMPQKPYR